MTMTAPEAGGQTALIERVKGIILDPKAEWPKIEKEHATTAGLYQSYILLLAAVPAVCSFIGALLFGYGALGITVRPSFMTALSSSLTMYVLTLAGVFVGALIVDFLAPTFKGQRSLIQALKLVAYGSTAGWLAGVFSLLPALSILGILGLYSVYLIYVGLPVMMKNPPEKTLPYMAVILVVGIVAGIVAGALTGGMTRMAGLGGGMSSGEEKVAGTVHLPGGISVDVGKLEEAAKQIEAAGNAMGAATGAATGSADASPGSGAGGSGEAETASTGTAAIAMVEPDKLKELLPAALPGGFERGEVQAAMNQLAGLGGSTSSADYKKDDHTINVSVTDMGVMGAIMGLGTAFGAKGTEQSATYYEKLDTINGRMVHEEFDSATKSGSYGVVVGNRILVKAEGTGVSMDALKAAVDAVGLDKAELLLKSTG